MQYYCERCGPGLWAEPLNALSNAAFLIAAAVGWWLARRRRVLTPGVWLLVGLAACIGVGSGLWHTFATDWASLMDVVPISLFQVAWMWLYGRHAVKLSRAAVAAAVAAHIGLTLWLGNFDEYLNGSLAYIPTILVGVLAAVHQIATAGPVRRVTVASAVVFWVGLVARSIDLVACRQLPIGTHFVWHILNGLVVFFALYAVVVLWVQPREGKETKTPV